MAVDVLMTEELYQELEVHPFKVQVSQEIIDEVSKRLAKTRFPDEVAMAGWDYGSSLTYMRELVDYWRNKFNWKTQERLLNAFHHYKATVGESTIHFVQEKGKGPSPLPLIISHGWPDSFAGMLKLVPLLTDPSSFGGDPSDAFDVVIPSLPGYGFSDRPSKRGRLKVYETWSQLMTRVLGYKQYGAQGGDVGAGITSNLGGCCPDEVVGIHLHSDLALPDPMPDQSLLSGPEKKYLKRMEEWEKEEGAYGHLQGTKPQTLAYGLNDSPVGLAAYIVEKFRAWSDCKGDLERRFSKDELLTNVMIYWVTQTINSSMRGYYEYQHNPGAWRKGRVEVPTGVAMFSNDLVFPYPMPREMAERSYNIQHWTQMSTGGHFAAREEPLLLADDIRAFFRPLRAQLPTPR